MSLIDDVTSSASPSQVNLDIYSCLHFLMELYRQLLAADASPATPLMQLNQTIQSVSHQAGILSYSLGHAARGWGRCGFSVK